MKFVNIENDIVRPLEMCATEGLVLTCYEENTIKEFIDKCTKEKEHLYIMDQLQPIYENYLKGRMIPKRSLLEEVMERICNWDIFYGRYITKLDLIETAISWADNNVNVRVYDFLNLLIKYYQASTDMQWDEVERKVWQEMTKLEVYGNRRKAGYLALLHGFLRIFISRTDPAERKRYLELLYKEWDYLKLVYSVMIRCIVDCGHKDFAGVANNVRILSSCHPYIHIFYVVLSGRFVDLCQSGTDSAKLSNHLNKIMEIGTMTTQDFDYLDPLCRILFPNSFQEYLEKNRMPSYDEVFKELQAMKAKVDSMNSQVEQMAQRMADAVKSAIPVEDIERELLRLSPGTGYDVFTQVNSLLIGNKAWMEHANSIKEKILEKRDNPSVQNIVYPQAGCTANIGCDMKQPEFKVLQGSTNQPAVLERMS